MDNKRAINRLELLKPIAILRGSETEEAVDMAIEALKAEQPKHGHWIEQEGFDSDVYYDCSVCGESWVTVEGTPEDNGMIYCPHCGAKMDEPKDGEQE